MKKQVELLIPTYMAEFKCIGGECEDTCCAGWSVYIDKKTYKKYTNLNTSELGRRLAKYMTRATGEYTDGSYAWIELQNRTCPFLTEQKRCEIQERLGASYLSHTCQTYPRKSRTVGKRLELSGVLSCPEITRQVILEKDGLSFQLKKCDCSEVSKYSHGKHISEVDEIHFFENIRFFLIQLIQDRRFSLKERLIMMIIFTESLSQKIKNEEQFNIEEIIQQWSSLIELKEWQISLKDMTNFIQSDLILSVMIKAAKIPVTNHTKNTRFLSLLQKTLNGLNGDNSENIVKRFEQGLEMTQTIEELSTEIILENYIVHYLFHYEFLMKTDFSMSQLGELLVRIAFLRTLWIGLYYSNKTLTLNDIVQSVQTFSKAYEHNKEFRKLIQLLVDEKLEENVTNYFSILIL